VENAAIVRVEQIYPLCEEKLRAAIGAFPANAKIVWCQEESQNMGAWFFIEPRLRQMFRREVTYAGRNASASPAVGALTLHKREQAQLIEEAFTL
jgi:2-oxoglutarate dehydrogenase E1 component